MNLATLDVVCDILQAILWTDMTVNPNILHVLTGTMVVLSIGSLARLVSLSWAPPDKAQTRRDSLLTWWCVITLFFGAALLGRGAATLLFVAISAAAFQEFRTLRRRTDRDCVATPAAGCLIAFSYLWIWLGWTRTFVVFLPVAAFLALTVSRLWATRNSVAVQAIRRSSGDLLLAAYAPAYAVLLFLLPPETNPVAGGTGWFLFLLLLTETNDIAQALIGRQFGKRPIAPRISPHKTWMGFVGGIVISGLLAVLLARWLTPWKPAVALTAGLLISLSGFFGGLNFSAMKRQYGVKDSGHCLPGQGGVLDRLNSLTFTAPMFYWLVALMSTRTS